MAVIAPKVCVFIKDRARGTAVEVRRHFLHLNGRDKRLATKTGIGFSVTELAGKVVIVSKETVCHIGI
jgi:hypothetical protein